MLILSILFFIGEMVVGGVSLLIFTPIAVTLLLLCAALIGGEVDYTSKNFRTFSFISHSKRATIQNATDPAYVVEVFISQDFTKRFNSIEDSTIDSKNYVLDLYYEGIMFLRKSDRKQFFIKNINVASLFVDKKRIYSNFKK